MELHLHSYVSIEIETINLLEDFIGNKNFGMILSSAILRGTIKLSLIGTYIKEQQADVNKISDNLIRTRNAEQLYQYNFAFD